MVWFKQLTPC
jgi:hypothetical protein